MSTDSCFSCRAPIQWARTERGNRIPLDPIENLTQGNLIETGETIDGEQVMRVIAPGSMEDALHTGPRFVSHFATCPHADRHRRSR